MRKGNCPCTSLFKSSSGISSRPFASVARSFCFFLLFSEAAQELSVTLLYHFCFTSSHFQQQSLCYVFPRLLEANRHLTAEGGAILLQRGATETPAGKGLRGDRAHHSAGPTLGVGREQCQQPLSSAGYRVPQLQVYTA